MGPQDSQREIDLLSYQNGNLELAIQAVKEMDTAENACDRIQSAAERVKRVLPRSANFQTRDLDRLVLDYKTTYAFIRRQIRAEFPEANIVDHSRLVAKPNDQFVENLKRHSCLCPLTVFLRLVAESLTRLRIDIDINPEKMKPRKMNPGKANAKKDTDKNILWGKIRPLQEILNTLNKNIKPFQHVDLNGNKQGPQFYPGVAACLMFHEENSCFTVTSSAVRFQRLTGLGEFGYKVRQNYIQMMRGRLPSGTQKRIEEVEKASQELYEQFENKDWKTAPYKNPFKDKEGGDPGRVMKVELRGQAATVNPNGNYKVACLVDFCRFVITRPTKGDTKEDKQTQDDLRKAKRGRQPFPANSCAEWEMWITILSKPEPPSTAMRRPVAKYQGMPRSNTYANPTTDRHGQPERVPVPVPRYPSTAEYGVPTGPWNPAQKPYNQQYRLQPQPTRGLQPESQRRINQPTYPPPTAARGRQRYGQMAPNQPAYPPPAATRGQQGYGQMAPNQPVYPPMSGRQALTSRQQLPYPQPKPSKQQQKKSRSCFSLW
ncbi:hypothetical protein B0H66DRAFT_613531 [Apodospora peruviana]|uniref:Uncharacterized protein n=1 Tax=Apodospora peruviana TaxID=516989 RepID=A0AAE0MGF6_9PEZI|nr:hypothetical protein B0H66DRAFT_613531 [Apodospora peruviana]